MALDNLITMVKYVFVYDNFKDPKAHERSKLAIKGIFENEASTEAITIKEDLDSEEETGTDNTNTFSKTTTHDNIDEEIEMVEEQEIYNHSNQSTVKEGSLRNWFLNLLQAISRCCNRPKKDSKKVLNSILKPPLIVLLEIMGSENRMF